MTLPHTMLRSVPLSGSGSGSASYSHLRQPQQLASQQLVSLRCFARFRPAARHRRLLAARTASGGDDLDIAVFRFTLGIPGFDDNNIPRVIGSIGAALLIANHSLAGSYVSAAQARTEALGAIISAVCIATPTVQARLEEMRPGRVQGSSSSGGSFLLSPQLTDTQRKEFAWASYALLRNTNVTGVLLWHGGTVLTARGALGLAAQSADAKAALTRLSEAVHAAVVSSADLRRLAEGDMQPLYLPDAAALRQAGVAEWTFVPPSAQSLLAISLSDSIGEASIAPGLLLLCCDQARGLSQRQRCWASAIAAKLAGFLTV